jgi:hypothetical protein
VKTLLSQSKLSDSSVYCHPMSSHEVLFSSTPIVSMVSCSHEVFIENVVVNHRRLIQHGHHDASEELLRHLLAAVLLTPNS